MVGGSAAHPTRATYTERTTARRPTREDLPRIESAFRLQRASTNSAGTLQPVSRVIFLEASKAGDSDGLFFDRNGWAV